MKETKQQLLQEGYKFFLEKGYNATGIQEITDATNVSKGSFYNHFKHKEIFANELIKDFGTLLKEEHMRDLTDPKIKPLKRLKAFYQKKISAVIHKENFKRGCVVSNLCQEVGDRYEDLAGTIDDTFEGMAEAIKKCLNEAQETGDLDQKKDTGLLAEAILNSWNGALMRVKASRNARALDAFLYSLDVLLT